MYCVDCGKDKPIFRDGSCLDCYLKNHQFIHGPDVFHIPVCNYCDGYKYKNTWKNDSFEDVVKRYVKNAFTFSPELKDSKIMLDCHDEEDNIFCKVTFVSKIDNETVSEDHYVEIRLKPNVCDICSKQFGGYHEAILQIRSSEKKMSEQQKQSIEQFLDTIVHSMQKQGNRKLFVTDKNYEKTGVDYLLSDKQAAASIIKKAQEAFCGEITVSSSNVGMNDGKQVYRMTYLLRLPSFDKHSILAMDDSLFFVTSLSNNTTHVIDLKTWNTHTFPVKYFEKAMAYDYDDLVQDMIVVSQKDDEIQVMDKNTYKILVINKPKKITYPSEQIPVVRYEDSFFLLPEINGK